MVKYLAVLECSELTNRGGRLRSEDQQEIRYINAEDVGEAFLKGQKLLGELWPGDEFTNLRIHMYNVEDVKAV